MRVKRKRGAVLVSAGCATKPASAFRLDLGGTLQVGFGPGGVAGGTFDLSSAPI